MRSNSDAEIKDPKFIQETQPTSIETTVLFTTLAVITKSAAALLIKRHFRQMPSNWKVMAIPYHGVTKELDLDVVLGEAKLFDIDVKVYIKSISSDCYLVLYLAYEVMLYLFFVIDGGRRQLKQISKKFVEADQYCFKGQCINDLVDYQWKKM